MWRGVSARKVAQLIFGPMLVETLSMLTLAWMCFRAVELTGEPKQQMWIPAIGSVAYSLSSYLSGRWVRSKTAKWLMLGTVFGVFLMGSAAMIWPSYWMFIAAVCVTGALIGHYYVPFQINMTHVQPFRTTAWSVAFYCVAWGTGGTIGPFLSGWFETQPIVVLIGIAAAVMLMSTALNIVAMTAPPAALERHATMCFKSTAHQRVLTIVAFLVVGLSMRGVFITLWPFLCDERGWSSLAKGVGMSVMMINVPIWAMIGARLRRWLRSPVWLIGGMLICATGMVLLPLMPSYGWALLAVWMIGMGEGVCVYYGLYYAHLDAESHEKSVGWMEACAGASFMLGPIVLGLLAWDSAGSTRLFPYAVMAGAIVVVAGYVWVRWSAEPRADQAR